MKPTTICPKCSGTHNVKSGFMRDKQRYKCKECNHHFTEGDKRSLPATTKQLAIQMYVEGLSSRNIERILGVSHGTIANWTKNIEEHIASIKKGTFGRKQKLVAKLAVEEVGEYIHQYKEKKNCGWVLMQTNDESLRGKSLVISIKD